jgi:DNA invertase Pin-like site-specific DNA recombinase
MQKSDAKLKVTAAMTTIGYARVSTGSQDFAGQIAALEAAGAAKVYREKLSGAKSDRLELAKAIDAFAPGDVLLVCRLDRLARSTRDLLNLLEQISQRGALFRSIAEPHLSTDTPAGKLMLTVLGGLAEFERSLIQERTDAGIRRARASGIRFGRRPKLTPFQRREALERLEAGELQSAIARSFNVDQSTISRIANR